MTSGYLNSFLKEEMAAVQLAQRTAQQQADIDRAYRGAQEKCLRKDWRRDLTALQEWALSVAAVMEGRQWLLEKEQEAAHAEEEREAELRALLGSDCPPRQRELFKIHCDWRIGLASTAPPERPKPWDELTEVPDDIHWKTARWGNDARWGSLWITVGSSTKTSEEMLLCEIFPEDCGSPGAMKRLSKKRKQALQRYLRLLQLELNLRLQSRNAPIFVIRPDPDHFELARNPDDIREILGADCPPLPLRLFTVLRGESQLTERLALEAVYSGKIGGVDWDKGPAWGKLSATEFKQWRNRLRSLQRVLNGRLSETRYKIDRPGQGGVLRLVDRQANTDQSQEDGDTVEEMLRKLSCQPQENKRQAQAKYRRTEVDGCKRFLETLFQDQSEVRSTMLWRRCRARRFRVRFVRLALKELPVRAERNGFGSWVYRRISQP
jgi:hypothetical protein